MAPTEPPTSPSPGGGGRRGPRRPRRRRPNVVLILADDLGYSDVGCFGASDIRTPHIDSLARSPHGVRFSQMYNCARCCPSRASLLTGLYPHQAGIGHMVHDSGVGEAYQGYLREDCATVAEVLRDVGGYRTLMAGKWHVGGEYPPHLPEHWAEHAGDATHPTPTQRGFDEFYGTLGGGGSYYDPPTLMRNGELIPETPDDYYYTDAINDEACRMIREATASSAQHPGKGDDDAGDGAGDSGDVRAAADDSRQPFFLYVAHAAPHWPLHAPPDIISAYRGTYADGWDALRGRRHARLKDLGLIDEAWECSPRDEQSRPWEECDHPEWEDARMAAYAAQIDVMDRGIGRILNTLRNTGTFDDTLVMFLSDNGGCAEFLRENGEEGSWTENYGLLPCSDGTLTKVGNIPGVTPGGKETFMSYDLPWANASNSPFRLFKSWVHEGGIATPFVAHWPNGIRTSAARAAGEAGGAGAVEMGRIHHGPWILMDIVATIYDVCGVEYPTTLRGRQIPPLEGESFASMLAASGEEAKSGDVKDGSGGGGASQTRQCQRRGPLFWEHQGNRAVRDGRWKLVHRHGDEWELFDMERDRTELTDLSRTEPERVERMAEMWKAWAERCGVKAWPLQPIEEGERDWPHFPWLW